MNRDDRRRDANDFVADRLRNAPPAQQQAVIADAQRKGVLREGEGRVVDGRIHSETISKIVAGGARRDDG